MKTMSILVISAVLCLGGVACGGGGGDGGGATAGSVATAVTVTPEIIERGHEIYTMNCVPCHGPGGKGDGPSAATLNPPPRDHTDPALMENLTDKKVGQTVQMGGVISGYPNMPSSPHIRGDDLVALVAFVRSLHRETVESVDLEDLQ